MIHVFQPLLRDSPESKTALADANTRRISRSLRTDGREKTSEPIRPLFAF